MLDDILEALVEGYVRSRTPSRRWQALARVFFGLLGAGLCLAGAAVIIGERKGSLPLRFSFVLLFAGFGSIWLFNVALLRKWRWPLVLFVAGFVLIFVTRLVFGP